MAISMDQHYPPDLSPEQAEYLISNLKDWSVLHGLAVRPPTTFVTKDQDPSRSLAVTAPVTLFPSLFPRACFEQAKNIQKAYNELYAYIASDEKWLGEIVEEIVDVDDFIAKLWNVHLTVKMEGYVQGISLGLFRSDYMIHKDWSNPAAKPEIRQVEFNTIASSFGGLASKVSSLHQHLLSISAFAAEDTGLIKSKSLPQNPTITALSAGLATAHQAYGKSKSSSEKPLCIIFIVQSPENNAFDQHALSDQLWTTHSIPNFRLPFSAVLDHTTVEESNVNRPLLYHPPHLPQSYEATTCYFRAGYSPTEYSKESAWTARLQLERSAAIKCPTILTHLAGSKKIQQVLATPSSPHLQQLLSRSPTFPDPQEVAAQIRSTFASIYPLDSSNAGKKAIAIATSPTQSAGYVLKPQREGGGNNIYGTKIPTFLNSLGNDERKWKGHILMELIQPPSLRNSIIRNGEVRSGEVIGELGVFGVCLWRHGTLEHDAEILANWEAGHLLRTKGRESEEGGVAAGFGAVDSPCLVEV